MLQDIKMSKDIFWKQKQQINQILTNYKSFYATKEAINKVKT